MQSDALQTGLICPECGSLHPFACGKRVFAEARCLMCKEFKSPCVHLPCGHVLCDEDLATLGGTTEESTSSRSGNSEDETARPTSNAAGSCSDTGISPAVTCRVTLVLPEGREEQVSIKLASGMTTCVLQHRVAEAFTKRTGSFVDSNRVALFADGVKLVIARERLANDLRSVVAKVDMIESDWHSIVIDLPRELSSHLMNLASRSLDDDTTWGDSDEFHLLVQEIRNLCRREQRRGSADAFDEETEEILEVLHEATHGTTTTPSSVLIAVREEFG